MKKLVTKLVIIIVFGYSISIAIFLPFHCVVAAAALLGYVYYDVNYTPKEK